MNTQRGGKILIVFSKFGYRSLSFVLGLLLSSLFTRFLTVFYTAVPRGGSRIFFLGGWRGGPDPLK